MQSVLAKGTYFDRPYFMVCLFVYHFHRTDKCSNPGYAPGRTPQKWKKTLHRKLYPQSTPVSM